MEERLRALILDILFCMILAFFFLIEALIKLRKMIVRKKLFDIQLGNCSIPSVLIFCRFTGFTKMQLTYLLDGRFVSDKLFFSK